MANYKKRFGDRRDGRLMRELDSMHVICPIIYPNRCDNEAFISEVVDISKAQDFLKRKNEEGHPYKYNIFQIIVVAALKTLYLRPKMNCFVANRIMYERDEVSASFVVKKEFADNGGEALAFLHTKPEDTFDSIHEEIYRQVSDLKSDKIVDGSTHSMDLIAKMPRFMAKLFLDLMRLLDKYGKVPMALIETDPYYSSIVLSNLGSVGLKSGYHHLTNWGTNSVFIAIGQMKKRPEYDDAGNVTMRDTVEIGLTIDERIADGYYYSKTVRLLKKLIENPELLEGRLDSEVEY